MCEADPSNNRFQRNDSENRFEEQVPVDPPRSEDELHAQQFPNDYIEGSSSEVETETSSDDDDVSEETMAQQNFISDLNHIPIPELPRATDLLMSVCVSADRNRDKITQLCIEAKDELIQLATVGEPLWSHVANEDGGHEKLNGLEYMRRFISVHDSNTLQAMVNMLEVEEATSTTLGLANIMNGTTSLSTGVNNLGFEPLRIEASRESKYLPIGSIGLVELLMDVKQWSLMFCNMVSHATLLGVWKPDAEGTYIGGFRVDIEFPVPSSNATAYDGMLQVLSAEFHMPTAFVPHRECQFARYCKRIQYNSWVVVDVSLESLFPYPKVDFRRRPSGCLIETNPYGISKVTWIKHVEVNTSINHPMFDSIIKSGFAFNAKRCLACIKQYCDSQQALMAPHSIHSPVAHIEGRNSLLKLAYRMMTSYYSEICTSSSNPWMPSPGSSNENIRVRTKRSIISPLAAPEDQIIITTSFLLAVPPQIVFDYLRNANSRSQWDILTRGHFAVELCHLVLDQNNPKNEVKLIDVRNGNTHKREIIYLQQSINEESISYVIYAPLNEDCVSYILHGGVQDTVGVLASGFAVFPAENSNSVVVMTLNMINSGFSLPTQSMSINQTILRLVSAIIGSIESGLLSSRSRR